METINVFKLARIKYNRNGHQSVKEVSEATGITGSLIDDLEATAGKKRGVSYIKISTLAKHYGVSTDFLCGMTINPYSCKTGRTIQDEFMLICDYVGLPPKTVEALHMMSIDKSGNRLFKIEAISAILSINI